MFVVPLLLSISAPLAEPVPIYLGTYTDPSGSKGIYRTTLNPANGALSEPILAVETTAPSYVVVHPNRRFLYAVNEFSGGEASAFAIQPNGKLARLNTVRWSGGGPCHISLNPSATFAFVSAYGGGTLAALPVLADGRLGEPTSVFKNEGSGPNRARQEAPHMHFAAISPDEKHVYACDLGTDEVLVFLFGPSGALVPSSPRSAKVPPGGGPRHLAFSRDGRFVYVNNEMTLGINVFARDRRTGSLTLRQTLSTLPNGVTTEGRSTAAVRLHPTGRWLYVSNRGHDSVAVFRVGRDGRLTMVSVTSATVRAPRDFAIDPSGKWMVIAGQDSNDVITMAIDRTTGVPTPTGHRIAVGKPVGVAF